MGRYFVADLSEGSILGTFATEAEAIERARELLRVSMGAYVARGDVAELESVAALRVGSFTWTGKFQPLALLLEHAEGRCLSVEVRTEDASLAGTEVLP